MRSKKPDNLYRVFRGGSWLNSVAALVRAAYRPTNDPASLYRVLGFRTVLAGRMPRV
jgi:formylglycine-generating enzyme required for sulfatase activity